MANILSEYKRWLESDRVDQEMKEELRRIERDEEQLKLRFSSPLSFGTAGLRGIMGAGIGNMNIHTVSQATKGLSDYVNNNGGGEVVIAYDSRNNSELFARVSAEVLAHNGIKTYVFDGPRPTPELSFAVRELDCIAGINITASHNPKEYNGYKAYASDGAQLSPEQAKEVSEYIRACDVLDVERADFDEAVSEGLIVIVGEELDEKYLNNVLAQRIKLDAIPSQSDMAIVYTPLHGAGYKLVPEVLRRAGLKNVTVVPEQEMPNGEFPTVRYPNPEFPEAFTLGIGIAKEKDCDLIIATDPDADRMGVMIRSGEGYIALTGNQMGCLLLDYIITAYRETTGVPADAYAVKSIVTTELASLICRENGVKMFDVLTGFKFIGEVIKKHEEKGFGTYLLGFEESYGYLKGTYARDKDAVVASLLAAEMAAYYRSRGMTLSDAINSLYERYGHFEESVMSIAMAGSDGKEKMNALMSGIRENAPKTIAGEGVLTARDYKYGTITDLRSGECEETGLPSADVLYYTTENCVLVIRPSGTEPKVKVYFMARGASYEEAKERIERIKESAKLLLNA